jgi:hypothetical protein
MTDVADAGDAENASCRDEFVSVLPAIARGHGLNPSCADAGPSPDPAMSAEVAQR